jgi:hypothetical protein
MLDCRDAPCVKTSTFGAFFNILKRNLESKVTVHHIFQHMRSHFHYPLGTYGGLKVENFINFGNTGEKLSTIILTNCSSFETF